jgi:predicted DNA-binding transcriptional regulator YafY
MDQPKFERLIRLLLLLIGNRRTTSELAAVLNCNSRTIQRYLDTFRSVGFVVEYRAKGIPFLSTNDGRLKDISDLVHFSPEEAFILHRAIDSIDDDTILKQNLKRKLYSLYNYPWLAELIVKPEQGKNVQKLIEAIEEKNCVKLINYRSSHTNKVSDREVEPYKFTTNYQQIWCYEPADNKCKLFKISRIGKVELSDKPWQFENLHRESYIDVFRISNFDYIGEVEIILNVRAYNLLIEEYPLAENYITPVDHNSFIFKTKVCSYEGVGRFVMGLYSEVKISGDKNFLEFIDKKILSIKSTTT